MATDADRRRYERFIAAIQERAGGSTEEAERAARAALETLSERLKWGEASELASELPEPVRTWLLEADGGFEPFHADEFVRRVAEREGVDLQTAERHARAVFGALARIVHEPEYRDLVRRMPNDYHPLLH